MNYKTLTIVNGDCDKLIILLSDKDFPHCLQDIEKEFSDEKYCRLLIDRLLITGDTMNRFVECRIRKGKIIMKSLTIAKPEIHFRQTTANWFAQHYEYVQNSSLPEEQKQRIKKHSKNP